MGVRFSGTFKPYIDNGDEEVAITIEDLEGGGNLPIRIVSYRTFTEGESRDPMTVINGKRAEMVFMIEDDTYAEFIDDMANAVTDRFVLKATSSFGALDFAGIVTHDFIEWEDTAYPFQFVVNAVDGLTRMKDLDYLDENDAPYADPDNDLDHYISMMQHILNCFRPLNLANIYGGDKERVWVQCNWWDAGMAGAATNPMEEAYVSTRLYYEHDNEGNLIAKSCYYVLESILTAMGCRIEYGRGIYKIEQITERKIFGNTYEAYPWDEVSPSTKTQYWNRSIESSRTGQNMPAAGGRFSVLSPLRSVKVTYDYDIFSVATDQDEDLGFGGLGAAKSCYINNDDPSYSGSQGANLRPIYLGFLPDKEAVKFRVTFQLMVATGFTGNFEDYINHRFLIRFYLGVEGFEASTGIVHKWVYTRSVTGFDPTTQEPEWLAFTTRFGQETTINIGGWDFASDLIEFQGAAPASKYYDIGFETIPIPTAVDQVTTFFCAELVEILTPDGNPLPGSYTNEWAISDVNIIVTKDDEKAKATKKTAEFTSKIQNGGKDNKDIQILFGNKSEMLRVWDGTELQVAEGWGVGSGGGSKDLNQLLAEEYHSIRGKPIRLMNRTIIGRTNRYMDNFTQFNYCDIYWISMITDHDHYRQEITGTWWGIEESYSLPPGQSGLEVEIGKAYNRIDTRNHSASPLPISEDPGWDGSGFADGDTEFVFTDGNLPDKTVYSEKQIRKKLDVYLNGNKLIYVEANPVGSFQHSINNTTNAITVDPNFPLSKRHVIHVFLKHG